ncbi:hypothetical protein LPJ57_001399 [Coemansia sp. RSA 486]|nr:hypothetical protein LPJ57_001399 [Coemansia sp. RSA 486]
MPDWALQTRPRIPLILSRVQCFSPPLTTGLAPVDALPSMDIRMVAAIPVAATVDGLAVADGSAAIPVVALGIMEVAVVMVVVVTAAVVMVVVVGVVATKKNTLFFYSSGAVFLV